MENLKVQKQRIGRNGRNGRAESYQGESYYKKPVVKSSTYGWLITAYFFIGGLASALQFISTVIDFLGGKRDKKLVSFGRFAALLGAIISPFLLIADLHTKRRWYNMLHIFRPTSPMSIGTWSLTTFGTFSGIAAVGQALETFFGVTAGRWLARLSSLPAALAGGVVSLYTGTLLATTSTPLWSTSFPYLSSLFTSSAASTAVAALTLAAHASDVPQSTGRRLSLLSIVSGAAELVLALLIDRNWRRNKVETPIEKEPVRSAWNLGVLGLGIIAPLSMHLGEVLSKKESRVSSIISAIAMLLGGFILRAVFVFGGNKSGDQPEDYLRITQPESWK
jgi:formate-dependent nitrite reductase membrane component NrfD